MQRFACAIVALKYAVSVHHGIHRTRASTGDAFDFYAAILEKFIHDAPAEGAMGASALQGKIDFLFHARIGCRSTFGFCRHG